MATSDAAIQDLMTGARENDLAKVQAAVEAGAEVNAADADKITALMHAAAAGHLEIVSFLLANGAPVNQQDANGRTALAHAIGSSLSARVIEAILEVGGRFDAPTVVWQPGAMNRAMSGLDDGQTLNDILGEYQQRTGQSLNLTTSRERLTIDVAAILKTHPEPAQFLRELYAQIRDSRLPRNGKQSIFRSVFKFAEDLMYGGLLDGLRLSDPVELVEDLKTIGVPEVADRVNLALVAICGGKQPNNSFHVVELLEEESASARLAPFADGWNDEYRSVLDALYKYVIANRDTFNN